MTEYQTDDLQTLVNDEKGKTWDGNIGLITVSEFIRANSNKTQCGSDLLLSADYYNNKICKNTNWLNTSRNDKWWTITARLNYSDSIIFIAPDIGGTIGSNYSQYYRTLDTYPVVHLNSNINLKGLGKLDDPFTITN